MSTASSVTFVCAVCGKSHVIHATEEMISRGLPIAPPFEWGSQSVWKQDLENGRVASVTLPVCSGICLISLQSNPDQITHPVAWPMKKGIA